MLCKFEESKHQRIGNLWNQNIKQLADGRWSPNTWLRAKIRTTASKTPVKRPCQNHVCIHIKIWHIPESVKHKQTCTMKAFITAKTVQYKHEQRNTHIGAGRYSCRCAKFVLFSHFSKKITKFLIKFNSCEFSFHFPNLSMLKTIAKNRYFA